MRTEPALIRIRLRDLHPGQRGVAARARRFNVVCCGRRWGKTTLGVDRAVHPALKGKPVAWFSPTYKMVMDVWRELTRTLAPVTARVSTRDLRVELVTGGAVDLWSLDRPDVARGRAYALVVVDEAAIVRDLDHVWQAVIRPTLTDYAGHAWFLSTPRGLTAFHRLYQLGQDPGEVAWASWRLPTTDNPYIDPAEVEEARRHLAERYFRQEYLAEFVADTGGVFRRVMEAATAAPQDRAIPGHEYAVSVDWGKWEDFTVFAVWDTTTRELVHVDRSNRVDYAVQVDRLRAVCERFRPQCLVIERNSVGDPLVEQLERLPWAPRVVPFTTTGPAKSAAIEALALALERGDLRVVPDPQLVHELQAYGAVRSVGGTLRYGAPPGTHDDCVMAAAIGWVTLFAPPRVPVVAVYDHRVAISPV